MRLTKRPKSQNWFMECRVNGRNYVRSTKSSHKPTAAKIAEGLFRSLQIESVSPPSNEITLEDAVARYLASRTHLASHYNLLWIARTVLIEMDGSMLLSAITGQHLSDFVEKRRSDGLFRSSPAIRDFCQSVLASGATLFTNFENSLVSSQSVFTIEEERKAQPVTYNEYVDDSTMIISAFRLADELRNKTKSQRSNVLITTLDDELLDGLRQFSEENNKPVTYLERRGDFMQIEQAEKSGHVVLGHADFVGGLEFEVVLVVGVDKGHVPQDGDADDSNSRNYSSYSAHNRLYVASSRAKFGLSLLGVKSRGPSELLRSANSNGLIDGVSF